VFFFFRAWFGQCLSSGLQLRLRTAGLGPQNQNGTLSASKEYDRRVKTKDSSAVGPCDTALVTMLQLGGQEARDNEHNQWSQPIHNIGLRKAVINQSSCSQDIDKSEATNKSNAPRLARRTHNRSALSAFPSSRSTLPKAPFGPSPQRTTYSID